MEDEGDGMAVADLAILEFYLHRSTMNRLLSYPAIGEERSLPLLVQANVQTQIVDSTPKPHRIILRPNSDVGMIKTLQLRFKNDETGIPMDAVLRKRLVFAAIIGNLFFYQHPSCPARAEGTTCCQTHRLQGYGKAVGLLEAMQSQNDAILPTSRGLAPILNQIKRMV